MDKYSLRGQVFQEIREDILKGKFKENEELREATLGKELGVSRTPVREALRQLELEGLIRYGASPRATIALTLAAKARAFLQGRGYVTPQDVKSIGHDVLRHRIGLTYEAEATNVTSDEIVSKILNKVEVP